MKLHSVGDIPVDGYEVKGVLLVGTVEEIQAFCGLYARGVEDFAIVPKRLAETESPPEVKP